MAEINENIKIIRLGNQWTQKEMANKLGISQNGYQKLESGESDITFTRLQQIADVFQMSVVEVIEYPNSNSGDSERVMELEVVVYNQNLDIKILKESLQDKNALLNHERSQTTRMIDLLVSIIHLLDVFHYIFKNERDTANLLNFKTHYHNWVKERVSETKQYHEELIAELKSKKTLSSEEKELLQIYKEGIININKALDNPIIESQYYPIFGTPNDIENFVSDFINKLKLLNDFFRNKENLEYNDVLHRQKIRKDFISILYR